MSPADGPEISILNRYRSVIIQQCLSQLPATQREVVDLVYYHEKSVAEVAQIINAPEGTVKTRMYYARRRLEELLKASGLDAH